VSRGGLGKAGRCLGLEGRLEWVEENKVTLAQKLKILGWFWELHLDVMNVPWRQEEEDTFESSLWMASRIRGAVHLKERVVQLHGA